MISDDKLEREKFFKEMDSRYQKNLETLNEQINRKRFRVDDKKLLKMIRYLVWQEHEDAVLLFQTAFHLEDMSKNINFLNSTITRLAKKMEDENEVEQLEKQILSLEERTSDWQKYVDVMKTAIENTNKWLDQGR